MNPLPSPIPVTVAGAAPEWWQIVGALSPLAVLVAAIVAATVGLLSLRQKAQADDRSEWWRRAQWALDASLSPSHSQAEMGQKAIEILGHSALASQDDLALLKVGTEDALLAAANVSGTRAVAPSHRPDSVGAQDRKVQIAAAKARVSLDKRLGEDTPAWIVALSAEKPG